jgi:hypothetical protein
MVIDHGFFYFGTYITTGLLLSPFLGKFPLRYITIIEFFYPRRLTICL